MDRGHLRNSLSILESDVDSLAKMALQNHRSLSIIFKKQKGLCTDLRETRCFYTNQSGVTKKFLTLIKNSSKKESQ